VDSDDWQYSTKTPGGRPGGGTGHQSAVNGVHRGGGGGSSSDDPSGIFPGSEENELPAWQLQRELRARNVSTTSNDERDGGGSRRSLFVARDKVWWGAFPVCAQSGPVECGQR
jgi:hypothetical protein